jgi:hypothetical protein
MQHLFIGTQPTSGHFIQTTAGASQTGTVTSLELQVAPNGTSLFPLEVHLFYPKGINVSFWSQRPSAGAWAFLAPNINQSISNITDAGGGKTRIHFVIYGYAETEALLVENPTVFITPQDPASYNNYGGSHNVSNVILGESSGTFDIDFAYIGAKTGYPSFETEYWTPGSYMLATAFTDIGGGKTRVTCPGHGFWEGDIVFVDDYWVYWHEGYYYDNYQISNVTQNTFDIDKAYPVDDNYPPNAVAKLTLTYGDGICAWLAIGSDDEVITTTSVEEDLD